MRANISGKLVSFVPPERQRQKKRIFPQSAKGATIKTLSTTAKENQ